MAKLPLQNKAREGETGFCHVGQAGLELLASSNPLTTASQSAGITCVSHHAWPRVKAFSAFYDLVLTLGQIQAYGRQGPIVLLRLLSNPWPQAIIPRSHPKPEDPQEEQRHGSPVRLFRLVRLFGPARLLRRRGCFASAPARRFSAQNTLVCVPF
ncbi:Protein GVQW1 [Plecturocebus cupreus]